MNTKMTLWQTAVVFGLSAASAGALAELPTAVVFGGAQAGPRNDFAYLGMIQPLPGAQLGQGVYGKAMLSWLDYRYGSSETGPITEVRSRGTGIEFGAGYAWRYGRGTVDLSATAGYRDLRVTPFVPQGQEAGSVLTLNPQVSASIRLNDRVSADLIANHAIGLGHSWARTRLGMQPSGSWRAGIEAIFLDGRNYQTRQHGVFFSLPLDAVRSLEFSIGRSEPRGEATGTYVAAGFAFTF
jgi:hypothetical protein